MEKERERVVEAAEWSVKDCMILVNEYEAVDADYSLSSYEKWDIISHNCSALWDIPIPRTSNQCRRKWDALLHQYSTIKHSRHPSSFWTMDPPQRRFLGLPKDFDRHLYLALDNILTAQHDLHPSDPQADTHSDLNHVIAQLRSKVKKPRLVPPKGDASESIQESSKQEKPEKIQSPEEPEDHNLGEQILKSPEMEENAESPEEEEQNTMINLREKAEGVHAIIREKIVMDDDDLKNGEDLETRFARHQAERLIACFQDIVNTLHQLNGVV